MKNILLLLTFFGTLSANAMEARAFYDATTGDVATLILNPVLSGTDFPLLPSSENGICKMLGYQRAAVGGMRMVEYTPPRDGWDNSDLYKKRVVELDEKGYAKAVRFWYPVTQVVCVNKIDKFPNEQAVTKKNPIAPGGMRFAASNEDGICRLLGFPRGLPNSEWVNASDQFGRVTLENVVKVDDTGSIVEAMRGGPVTEITCLMPRSQFREK